MRLRRKRWSDAVIDQAGDLALGISDLNSLPAFDCLEIGSGRGKFLIEMAKKHPENDFLGVEMNFNAFALAVKRALNDKKEDEKENYHFLNATMEELLDKIPVGSLNAIYLNFSDPWIKKKQYKRRLTYPTRLIEYYRLLKVGGKIYFKTDNLELYQASVEYFRQADLFEIEFEGVYEKDDADDVCTEFEEKFRSQGCPIYRIVAKKADDSKMTVANDERVSFIPEVKLREMGKIARMTERTFKIGERQPLEGARVSLSFKATADATLCGLDYLQTLLLAYDKDCRAEGLKDGQFVKAGTEIFKAEISPEIISKPEFQKPCLWEIMTGLCSKIEKEKAGKPTLVLYDSSFDKAAMGYAGYLSGVKYFSDRDFGSWLSLKSASFIRPIEVAEDDKKCRLFVKAQPDVNQIDSLLDQIEGYPERVSAVLVDITEEAAEAMDYIKELRKGLNEEGFKKVGIALFERDYHFFNNIALPIDYLFLDVSDYRIAIPFEIAKND